MSLFSRTDATSNNTGGHEPINLAPVLVPSGTTGGLIDVVSSFPWTLTPPFSKAREETPYIELVEYNLFDSYINQLFNVYNINPADVSSIFNAASNPGGLINKKHLYEGMYDLDKANATNFKYKLPFFSSTYLNTSNNWTAKSMYEEIIGIQKLVASIGGGTAGVMASIAKGVATAEAYTLPVEIAEAATGAGIPLAVATAIGSAVVGAGKGLLDSASASALGSKLAANAVSLARLQEQLDVGLNSGVGRLGDPTIDKPQIWNTTVPRVHNITFPLYNILGTVSDIVQNWELCYLLSYQNLYNKRNLFTGLPPVFYEITIPGVHYCKAGIVSNLSIRNIGNIHNIPLPVAADGGTINVNVPDAYFINMTVTDLFIPSKNFLDVIAESKSKVSASGTPTIISTPPETLQNTADVLWKTGPGAQKRNNSPVFKPLYPAKKTE